VRRVLVIGSCGSGKTTFARELSRRASLPFVELDALFHGPSWTKRPTFEADVDAATREERWVVDGNYHPVRDLLWSRADTIVWLDLPRWLAEARVVGRSFIRWVARVELWNGNRESGPQRWLDHDHPIRWGWKKHAEYRTVYAQRFTDPAFAHVQKERLRSPAEVRRFLDRA
jgi:adenylate kinase family enzyme